MFKRYLNISAKVFIVLAIVIGSLANVLTVDARTKIMLLDISFVLFTGAIIRMMWLNAGKS